MSQEFGDDFISITDEDGKEYELEVLAELEYEGSRYLALVPAGTDEAEELEVSILKSVEENGEDILVTIDDDEELENVYQALMDLIYDCRPPAQSNDFAWTLEAVNQMRGDPPAVSCRL